ncbi:transposase [Streptomyces sp. NPDC126514]|uniref:transposase n=1 Tax=Streptomyces sp. NPDC126514 TaxID=3155210 RepID=UPI00333396FE
MAAGGKTVRDRDAWLCFADEAGQLLRPPKACTRSSRGRPPLVKVRAAGSGRMSMACLVCRESGQRTRLVFRMLVPHGRKGEKRSFRERDFASLLDAAHHQLGGNIVLVWDNYSHHVDAAMRELMAKRPWLTVFRFPTNTPDRNPAEGVWAHLKKSLGNLAPCSIDDLAGWTGPHPPQTDAVPAGPPRRVHRRNPTDHDTVRSSARDPSTCCSSGRVRARPVRNRETGS